jgi:hypothetical protein
MKTLKLILLLVFISTVSSYCQFFTYTELINLKGKEHPIASIELFLSKGLEIYSGKKWINKSENENLYYYTYRTDKNNEDIGAFVMIDEDVWNSLPISEGFLQLQFGFNSKKYYDYLVERIKKYCEEFVKGFKRDNSWFVRDYWKSQNGILFTFKTSEEDGNLFYVIDLYISDTD